MLPDLRVLHCFVPLVFPLLQEGSTGSADNTSNQPPLSASIDVKPCLLSQADVTDPAAQFGKEQVNCFFLNNYFNLLTKLLVLIFALFLQCCLLSIALCELVVLVQVCYKGIGFRI